MINSNFLSRHKFAETLGISLSTCDRLIARGLPIIKISKRRITIKIDSALAWIEAGNGRATKPARGRPRNLKSSPSKPQK